MRSPEHRVDGAKLKAARELAGWTQAHLAKRVGVDRSAVALWESPDLEKQPSAANFKTLCAALKKALGRKFDRADVLVVSDDRAA